MGPLLLRALQEGWVGGAVLHPAVKPAVVSFRQSGSTHPASAFQDLKLSLKGGQARESVSR